MDNKKQQPYNITWITWVIWILYINSFIWVKIECLWQHRVWILVLNATFNNISAISWQPDLLVGGTGAPGENHWQILSHNVVSSTPRHKTGFELTILVVIGTDCTGSCKSNYMYHMIMLTTTTAPEHAIHVY
jgi:hypothetical protein